MTYIVSRPFQIDFLEIGKAFPIFQFHFWAFGKENLCWKKWFSKSSLERLIILKSDIAWVWVFANCFSKSFQILFWKSFSNFQSSPPKGGTGKLENGKAWNWILETERGCIVVIRCHQCGVLVEVPVARSCKGRWLCDTCWRVAERELERHQAEAAKGKPPVRLLVRALKPILAQKPPEGPKK